MQQIKIYLLKDPRTNEIRYVGKTKNSLTKRLYEHFTIRNLESNNHKNNWFKVLLKLNLRPIIELIEITNKTNWIEQERYWIKYHKEIGCKLTNSTDGGEGAFGAKMSPESIKKTIETKRKNGTLARSLECRGKISKAHMGKKEAPETTEKRAEKLRKILFQCDLNGKIIKKWKGVRKCARILNIGYMSIRACLSGKQKTYAGFTWRYE